MPDLPQAWHLQVLDQDLGNSELTEFLSAHTATVWTSVGSLAQAFPKARAAEGRHGARGPLQLPEQAPDPGNAPAVPRGREATSI